MTKRGAVVIGVDKTGGLTTLNAAAVCARRVADWLAGEGYTVECLTDEKDDVTLAEVKAAMKLFVTSPASYEQLVVYFTGHGYDSPTSDIWLLSEAPADADAAIDVDLAIRDAQDCGIANVAIISDACRSLPKDVTASSIRGATLFPNITGFPRAGKVDYVKATRRGSTAWEGMIGGEPWSVLTKAWMLAYEAPGPGMVKALSTAGGKQIHVVPNRKLEPFLQDNVNRLLFQLKLYASPQDLVMCVPSADDVYIATCPPPSPGPSADSIDAMLGESFEAPPQMTPAAEASAAISRDLSKRGLAPGGAWAPYLVSGDLTRQGIASRLPTPDVSHFETSCGFSISGARLKSATTRFGQAEPAGLRGEFEAVEALRIYPAEPVSPTLIEFEGGRGTVLPALMGYIGHITVTETGIASVSYVPSEYDHRFGPYAEKREQLDRLRALVALSSEGRTFHLRDEAEASDLLNEISFGASIDPSLSLYAAQAFSEIGAMGPLQHMAIQVREDLGTFLLDHLALADMPGASPATPDAPLLTRTWALLARGGVDVPGVYRAAQDHLCHALWTTFEPEGLALLKSEFDH